MTRTERLAAQAKREKDALDDARQKYHRTQRAQQADVQKRRTKRQAYVGALADHCGLLQWDDTTLEKLFLALAVLGPAPNPVAVLQSLMSDTTLHSMQTGAGDSAAQQV